MTEKKWRNKVRRHYLKQGIEFKVACYAAKHDLSDALKHYGWTYVGTEQRNFSDRYLYVKELTEDSHLFIITKYKDSEMGYFEDVISSGVGQGSAKERIHFSYVNDIFY